MSRIPSSAGPFCAVLLISGLATSAYSTTIHVPADAPTIQAGIDLASVGDTVLVACGTYYEHDIAMKSGVCLRSETGEPDCVVIDAQQLGRVFYCEYVDSTASIEGFTATDGHATGPSPGNRGGGMYCSESAPRVTDCDLVDNSADFGGGGMYCHDSSSPTLMRVAFTDNTARYYGGGMCCAGGSSPKLTTVVFSGNAADDCGGAIYCYSHCSPTLTNGTIYGNSASEGSGVYAEVHSSPSLMNSIISFGLRGGAVVCGYASSATLVCCDVFGNVGGDWEDCIADQYGVDGNFWADPLFCAPDSGDLQLYSVSPCVDAPGCGLIGAYGVGCYPSGEPRVWYILPDGTGDAPTIKAGMDSAWIGDTVLVAAGTYCEHDIAMKSGVMLTSESGQEATVIDAQQQGRILSCWFVDSTATVEGFTITGGLALGYGEYDGGGALYCKPNSYPVIKDCTFTGNVADIGGALRCWDSSPTFVSCHFIGNSASYGGGMACWDHAYPVMIGCTFSANVAGLVGGGGMYCDLSPPTLTDCVFSGNSASGDGGAIRCKNWSRATLTFCTISGNSSDTGGGAMSCEFDADPALDHCTLVGNSVEHGAGGLYLWDSGAIVENTIIAFNVGGDVVRCYRSDPTLICCNVYGNEGGDWVECIADQYGVNGNISEDPFFCDPENGNYHVRQCSPGASTPECGQIGALGVGCYTTDVWRILPDGTGDAPTIQAAVDSALPCDTLLIAAGTYLETVDTQGKLLVVMSESGSEVTRVRSPDSSAWVVSFGGVDTLGILKGLTIDGGFTRHGKGGERSGAYSCVYCGEDASPRVLECILQNALANGVECRDNANPVIGGSLENANRILTLAGVASFSSNVIDATYNYWGRDDHGCPENNVGLVQVVPFVDSTLASVFCDCHTLCVPEHYGAIQSAVDVALEGDTVEVAATDAVYDENVSVISKNLTVRVGEGEGTPTIRSSVSPVVHLSDLDSTAVLEGFVVDANAGESAIRVDSSHVTISDSRVTGATGGGLGGSGLVVSGSGGRVVGSQMDQNETGLLVLNSSTEVLSNRIVDNERGIVCGGSLLPRIGGSLEAANDIFANTIWNLENQAADSVDADFNYWGTIVYEEIAAKISGPARFCYWTDSTHTETYSCETTEIGDREMLDLPDEFYLAQNAPNPFNPATVIGFAVPAPGARVEVNIYDVHGRLVRRLVDDYRTPGIWCVRWDGKDGNGVLVSSGVYFCRMSAAGFVATRKMVLTQ